jgi:hypothetical protein
MPKNPALRRKKQVALPVSLDRLESMRLALIRHAYSEELDDCSPLSPTDAMGMVEEIERIERYFHALGRRPSRATPANIGAATLAHFLHKQLGWNKQDAAVAAFPNHEDTDALSLAKTVRNLLPKIEAQPFTRWPSSREIIEAQRRYKALSLGKLPDRKAKRK